MLRQVLLTREDTPVHYIAGPDEIAGIREAWRRLEEVVALRGRRFFGVVWPDGVYWAAVEAKHGVDDGDLAAGVIPGGAYTRSRLRGEPPAVYERIGPEMEALEASTRRDPDRPGLEHYRRRDEIDLLVPVAAA
jgi:hypothetical protein